LRFGHTSQSVCRPGHHTSNRVANVTMWSSVIGAVIPFDVAGLCLFRMRAVGPVVPGVQVCAVDGDNRVYTGVLSVYTGLMAKHLIDIDEQALEMARAELGTTTIKDTVNAALRQATSQREQRVAAALDTLAAAPLEDRIEAWR
jgi:Arc/MetJ family transcription regulator